MPSRDLRVQSHARRLRRSMTRQEVKLWVQLRYLNRRGFHFRRQVPLDGHILDFAEFTHRLIIEVDGSQHGDETGLVRDFRRDAHFKQARFRILRFWNADVDQDMDGIVRTVEIALSDSSFKQDT